MLFVLCVFAYKTFENLKPLRELSKGGESEVVGYLVLNLLFYFFQSAIALLGFFYMHPRNVDTFLRLERILIGGSIACAFWGGYHYWSADC